MRGRTALPLMMMAALLGACGAEAPRASAPAREAAETTPPTPLPPREAAAVGQTEPATASAAGDVQNEAARSWVAAVNAGDTAAFAATFGPSPVVVDSGRTFEGLEAIQRWSDRELLGAGGQITVVSEEPTGDGTILNVEYRSRVYNGRGRYVFVVEDGLISRIDMVPPVASAFAAGAPPAQLQPEATAPPAGAAPLTPEQQAAEATMRRFTETINRGDADGVSALFAPEARFDSIGRIYEGREAIMGRFLGPEVIAIGGQYEWLGVEHESDAVTVEYTFRAGALFEHFTYRCQVRDEIIQGCVGRYVR